MSRLDSAALVAPFLGNEPALPAREVALGALVARAQAGDASAFTEIVGRYEDRVVATARRLLGNREDALDAAQETFVRLFKYIGTFEPGRDLDAWIHRIVVNVSRRLGARRARSAPATPFTPGHGTEGDVRSGDLDRALALLTERERAALVLRDIEGLPTEEVARALGAAPATVRVHICMARKKIQRFLLGEAEGDR